MLGKWFLVVSLCYIKPIWLLVIPVELFLLPAVKTRRSNNAVLIHLLNFSPLLFPNLILFLFSLRIILILNIIPYPLFCLLPLSVRVHAIFLLRTFLGPLKLKLWDMLTLKLSMRDENLRMLAKKGKQEIIHWLSSSELRLAVSGKFIIARFTGCLLDMFGFANISFNLK